MVKRPNFLIIVADDLGFSDLGCYGGEISTPNLDKLAKDGLRMTGFHTASACSPTRSMLLSGTDNHLAGLGQMAERMNRNEETKKNYANQPGYEGVLNQRVAALSEILNQVEDGDSNGAYRTLLSGKWHLGLTEDTLPSVRGFERNWGLLPGCWNHYKWWPTTEDGKPLSSFMPGLYADGSRLFEQEELPEDFYSSKTYTDKAIEWLKEDKAQGDDRPFFAMLTYTAPHWPLQAPPEYIDKYKGRYDAGPSALRLERMASLEKLGLIPGGTIEHAHPEMPVYKTRDWEELDQPQRERVAKTMEIYAGMVDCLDHHIGRLLNYLEDSGELDNTFVLFMSDNGAEGALMEALPFGGMSKAKQIIDKYYNNILANLGNKDTFVNYGPRWAQAATAPSRLYKCWVTEGGTRCPCIIRYPRFAKERQAGAISHDFTTVMDICPTVLDLAKIPHPGKMFRGRHVHEPKGKSWLPWLQGGRDHIHDDDTAVGWELFGQQAMRKGQWKIVFVPKPSGAGRWELFDLKNDPGETKDLYQSEAAKLEELLGLWEKYRDEVGVIPSVYEEFGLHDGFEVPEDW